MACACRVSQDLSRLQNTYGVKGSETLDAEHKKAKAFIRAVSIWGIAIVMVIPFFLFTIVNLIFGNKPINIGKLFRIGQKNERKK